jgi:hypothetical protein
MSRRIPQRPELPDEAPEQTFPASDPVTMKPPPLEINEGYPRVSPKNAGQPSLRGFGNIWPAFLRVRPFGSVLGSAPLATAGDTHDRQFQGR